MCSIKRWPSRSGRLCWYSLFASIKGIFDENYLCDGPLLFVPSRRLGILFVSWHLAICTFLRLCFYHLLRLSYPKTVVASRDPPVLNFYADIACIFEGTIFPQIVCIMAPGYLYHLFQLSYLNTVVASRDPPILVLHIDKACIYNMSICFEIFVERYLAICTYFKIGSICLDSSS
jgi:hypothetical protein